MLSFFCSRGNKNAVSNNPYTKEPSITIPSTDSEEDDSRKSKILERGSNIDDENLDYIDVQIKYLGVAPGKEDGEAARIYDENHSISSWFNYAMIREQDYGIDGGSGYTITFTLKDKTSYTLNIKNNYLFEKGKTFYISSGLPYVIVSSFH